MASRALTVLQRQFRIYAAIILICVFNSPVPCQIPDTKIDAFLKSCVKKKRIPGVVAIALSKGKIVYHNAFGHQNTQAENLLKPDSIFRIASMTKPVTSVAVMQLIEQGKINLEEPVANHLPELAEVDYLMKVGKTVSKPNRITIRQLLNHTSGYGYWFSSPELAKLFQDKKKFFDDKVLLHGPGERWTYGCGTRFLGQVVEKVSGKKLDKYFAENIFRPLNMKDTGFAFDESVKKRLVSIYLRNPKGFTEQVDESPSDGDIAGDYGLRSTARDYTRFLQMLLNHGELDGRRILSKNSVVQMTSNQIGELVVEGHPGAIPAWSQPFPLGAGSDKFGLGFQIAAETIPGYRSKGSCSWAGIWNTHFWFDPQKEIAGVVLMQVQPFYDGGCIKVLRGFEKLVYESQDAKKFTRHKFRSNGTSIVYETIGDGATVVLVHGLTGSRNDFMPLARDFAKAGFRAIVIDFRGHGESGKPHGPDAYGKKMVLDLRNLLDHLSVESAHMVGYSMGGDIVNKFREQFPERTRSCVVGGAGLGVSNGWADEPHDFAVISDALKSGNGFKPLLKLPGAITPGIASADDIESVNKSMIDGQDPLALAALLRTYENLELDFKKLDINAIPTLVLAGTKDAEYESAIELKEKLKNSKFHEIEGLNHFEAWQDEAFEKATIEFVKSCEKK